MSSCTLVIYLQYKIYVRQNLYTFNIVSKDKLLICVDYI